MEFTNISWTMEALKNLNSDKIDPTITEIEDKHTRSTVEYWRQRVKEVGNHRSPFLDKPEEEIAAFTERHRGWVIPWVLNKDVCEMGCGYGRNMDMFTGAKTYMGFECVTELLDEAAINLKRVFKGSPRASLHLVDLRDYAFSVEFDICVAIAVVSSVEPYFHNLRKRMLESLRSGGVILWLEEDYVRIDYNE